MAGGILSMFDKTTTEDQSKEGSHRPYMAAKSTSGFLFTSLIVLTYIALTASMFLLVLTRSYLSEHQSLQTQIDTIEYMFDKTTTEDQSKEGSHRPYMAAKSTSGFLFTSLIVLTYIALAASMFLLVLTRSYLSEHQSLQRQIDNVQQNSNLNKIPSYIENSDNGRVKRDLNQGIISRQRRRANQKSKRRKNKKQSRKESKSSMGNAIHMQIDSTYSEPNNPELKTGEKGEIVRYWKEAYKDLNTNQDFAQFNSDGTVKILKKRGLYLIYTQITYYDRSGRWSHLVDISGKPFVKCIGSEWGIGVDPETGKQYNTVHQCYSSAVTMLNKGEVVSIKSMYSDRVIHVDTEMTFWGIIKLS